MELKNHLILIIEKYEQQMVIDDKGGKYLNRLKKIVEITETNKEKAIASFKDNTLSISKIAKEMGVSRQTLYNNSIIRECIEECISASVPNNIFEKNKELEAENIKQAQMIERMIKRDAELAFCKEKIKELEGQIVLLNKRIQFREKNK